MDQVNVVSYLAMSDGVTGRLDPKPAYAIRLSGPYPVMLGLATEESPVRN